MPSLYETCERIMTVRPDAVTAYRHTTNKSLRLEAWAAGGGVQALVECIPEAAYPYKVSIMSTGCAVSCNGPANDVFLVPAPPAAVAGLKAFAHTPASAAAKLAQCIPVPVPGSVYGYTEGGAITAICYYRRMTHRKDNRLGFYRFTLNGGPVPEGLQWTTRRPDYPGYWWCDVDAGCLICLDRAIADGDVTLIVHPGEHGPGFWHEMNGQRYVMRDGWGAGPGRLGERVLAGGLHTRLAAQERIRARDLALQETTTDAWGK